jgi:hypothetical protein
MGRLGELAVFIVLLWLFFPSMTRTVRRALGLGGASVPRPQPGAAPRPVETLVPCSLCGTYVTRSRTIEGRAGALFCSERCRRADPVGAS